MTKNNNSLCYDIQILIARISLVALFTISAIGKITGFSGTASFADSSWLPIAGEVLVVGAILLAIFGTITILSGWKMKEGAYALALYTLAATVLFHVGEGEMMNFLKNLAIFGGFLALAAVNPGKIAFKNK